MYGQRKRSLSPRNGHTLVVGIVARISGCANQKELSLGDQEDHAKQVVSDLYDGPVEYRTIATKGKGERLDRPELAEIKEMLRSGELDLLVAEDIGRMVRGTGAAELCGIAVDHGTRVLAPNDGIDTDEDSWEEDVISACRDHVGHNVHTSMRLKQKLKNRFVKFGGATPREIYGYIKPPGARTLDEWQKDPAATPIIQEGLRRLKSSLNCSAVADWLNAENVPTGKYCRRKTWDGHMVRRFYANPILKGRPGRGFRKTVKHHETGRRISVPNSEGPVFRDCPHLAHLDAAEFDEVNQRLDKNNERFRHTPVTGRVPQCRVPRRRTRFPGQHACCWYCGRRYLWGANGILGHLMCSGSREWRCWNSIGIDGVVVTEGLVEAILNELSDIHGFHEQFAEMVRQANQDGAGRLTEQRQQLERDEATLAREKGNLMAALKEFGPRPMIRETLQEIEANEKELAQRRRSLESSARRRLWLPESTEELRGLLQEAFRRLTIDSPEFGELMQQLVPDIHVYLVRLVDGGHLLPRARVRLVLSGILPDARHVPGLAGLLTRELTLDLFRPPQRERIRREAVLLADAGLTQRQIAAQIAERPKLPAVQRALALDRRMKDRGLESPYVVLSEAPDDYCKLRRHKNRKYRFESLDGYVRPAI